MTRGLVQTYVIEIHKAIVSYVFFSVRKVPEAETVEDEAEAEIENLQDSNTSFMLIVRIFFIISVSKVRLCFFRTRRR